MTIELPNQVALAGRSRIANVEVGRDLGHVKVSDSTLIDLEDIDGHRPEDIVIVVAGGDIPIPQNAYCPSWGFPPARITREIALPPDWPDLIAAWMSAMATSST